MRPMFRTLAAGALLLLALPCFAQSTTKPFAQNGFDGRMLNTSVPKTERLKLFAHVIKLAEQGQVKAMDLAGTMYWQGSKIAGSPVDKNLAQARKLLANAAIHGDVLAMAKMAELQLAAHHAQKAMVWAQLYAHYINPTKSARSTHGRGYVYASNLMARIKAAGGKANAAVQRDVNNMASRFDNSIRDGMDSRRDQRRSGAIQFVRYPRLMTRLTGKQINLSGWADYMVAFKPDGSIKHVWLLASWPTDEIATMMRPAIDHALINKADASAGIRYVGVSIPHYAHKGKTLRAKH